ncbi:hypothetical protein SAMN05192554_1419 [Haloarchaeobius iranensis]|uniref:Uncharacterized protein n=1 Tax=Haloarchaeobius iranensis TaxID=996166 RepID=A0A1H0BIV0_9EURY|nr:hypothetical protein SAMN05192554_1419 [Haloarchaeobius iranensis]
MVPAMAFFQQEQAKQRLHLVARRACIPVVSIELDVCQRHCMDEWIDAIVIVMLKPCFCNEANIQFYSE